MPSPLPNPFVVVVTRRPLEANDPVARVLAPLNATVVGVWQDDPRFPELAAQADAFVFSGGFSKKMFDAAPKCQIVARDGIGYDTVDIAAATARGIWVTIIPDALIDDVADHAMMLLMSANRRLAFLDDATRAGQVARGRRRLLPEPATQAEGQHARARRPRPNRPWRRRARARLRHQGHRQRPGDLARCSPPRSAPSWCRSTSCSNAPTSSRCTFRSAPAPIT